MRAPKGEERGESSVAGTAPTPQGEQRGGLGVEHQHGSAEARHRGTWRAAPSSLATGFGCAETKLSTQVLGAPQHPENIRAWVSQPRVCAYFPVARRDPTPPALLPCSP